MNTTNHTSPSGEELKPCPFCGGAPKGMIEYPDERSHHALGCTKCGFSLRPRYSNTYEDREKATLASIADWNHRAAASTQPIGEDAANGATLPAWFDAFLTNICELPDRNSPDGEPDAVVATLEELKGCALDAIGQTKPDEIAADALQREYGFSGDIAAKIVEIVIGSGRDRNAANGAIGEREAIIELLKRARYVRHEDLPADIREETETRAAYGNSAAWQDARGTEQMRLINEAIKLLEARAALTAEKVAAKPISDDHAATLWRLARMTDAAAWTAELRKAVAAQPVSGGKS